MPASSPASVSSPRPRDSSPTTGAAPAFRRPLSLRAWFVAFAAAKLGALALFLGGQPLLACLSFFSVAPWLAWQIFVSASQGLCPTITRFSTTRREVWLTIDDGPDPATTPRVLDLLDAHRARATFFVIGEKVARHPDLIAEILRRGHTVANHTHTHPCYTFWYASRARISAEIERAARALRAAGAPTGSGSLVRTPVGVKTFGLHPALAAHDAELVGWSARGFDTISRRPARAVERIARDLSPGAIVLLHESGPLRSHATQLDILTRLLDVLARDGYRCVVPDHRDLIRPS